MTTAVNYDTVTQAAADVRLTSSTLTQKLEDLMTEVNRVASNWEGEAKIAYRESQDRLTRGRIRPFRRTRPAAARPPVPSAAGSQAGP